uniref:Uncharacterized protein n=1 Tax=Mycena chlorophos TaxID=658473 RepID=A0ABQ0LN52_MYCCL|nr:predicted protein [Mycena chlorophos]
MLQHRTLPASVSLHGLARLYLPAADSEVWLDVDTGLPASASAQLVTVFASPRDDLMTLLLPQPQQWSSWPGSASFTAPAPLFMHSHPAVMQAHAGPSSWSHWPGTQAASPTTRAIPAKNTRPLDKTTVLSILEYLSTRIAVWFGSGRPVRLLVHGGAVFVLDSELAKLAAHTAATDRFSRHQRTTTRDVDIMLRAFVAEWAAYGVLDAGQRLKRCILETAQQFRLGADWMNSDADVALPMATDPTTGKLYDPISTASFPCADALTLFTSRNALLQLVSVTPFWAVALKMVRYNPADKADICILLRSGTLQRGIHWTPTSLEYWLLGHAWAMGYANYDPGRVAVMRWRMAEVVEEVSRWDPGAGVGRAGWSRGIGTGYAWPAGGAHAYAAAAESPPVYTSPVPERARMPEVDAKKDRKKAKEHHKDKHRHRQQDASASTTLNPQPNVDLARLYAGATPPFIPGLQLSIASFMSAAAAADRDVEEDADADDEHELVGDGDSWPGPSPRRRTPVALAVPGSTRPLPPKDRSRAKEKRHKERERDQERDHPSRSGRRRSDVDNRERRHRDSRR